MSHDFELKTVRQPPGSKTCLIACVAMLTGRTIEDLIDEFGVKFSRQHQAYWSFSRATLALATYGWQGFSFQFNPDSKVERLDPFEFDISHSVAIVSVESAELRYDDGSPCLHCVVYDPNIELMRDPCQDDPQPLNRYRIHDWNPFTKYLPYDGPNI